MFSITQQIIIDKRAKNTHTETADHFIAKAGQYTGIPKQTNGIDRYDIRSSVISVYRQFPVYRKFRFISYIEPRV